MTLASSGIDASRLAKPIGLYIALAFSVPLVCVLLMMIVRAFRSGIPRFVLYGIEAATPTLAALLVTVMLGGRRSLTVFVKGLYVRNVRVRYIVLAALIPVMMFTAARLVWFLSDVRCVPFFASITPQKLVIIAWALVAEEVGWRGFLQPRVGTRLGYIATPLVVGSVWALWHYHFFWSGTMASAPVGLFAVGCVAESYGYYWVTTRSKGNIIPASVWHFTGNLCMSAYTISPESNHSSIRPYALYTGFAVLMASIVTVGTHRSHRNLSQSG